MTPEIFKELLEKADQADYPSHSRVHPLRSFNFPEASCYVKRDDELGFGISGSKIRKYRTLIPFLISQKFQEVVVIGSAYSNHVLSFSQLLVENGIKVTLFLRGDPKRTLQGNALLTSVLIPPNDIRWFAKNEWKEVETSAHIYATSREHPTFVLPEGGFTPEALPGALTLPKDLLRNEKELALQFDHLFIEAGTGFTAIALLLGMRQLGHQGHLHILLLAEDEGAFLARLKQCHVMFNQWLKIPSEIPDHFTLYRPTTTKGFGEISPRLFASIAAIARSEGFLTDPIYSAKLFVESRRIIEEKQLSGNVLLFHTGGALTLFGFQSQLQELFTSCC